MLFKLFQTASPDLRSAEDIHQDQQRSSGSHTILESRAGYRQGTLRDLTGEVLTVIAARGGGHAFSFYVFI